MGAYFKFGFTMRFEAKKKNNDSQPPKFRFQKGKLYFQLRRGRCGACDNRAGKKMSGDDGKMIL